MYEEFMSFPSKRSIDFKYAGSYLTLVCIYLPIVYFLQQTTNVTFYDTCSMSQISAVMSFGNQNYVYTGGIIIKSPFRPFLVSFTDFFLLSIKLSGFKFSSTYSLFCFLLALTYSSHLYQFRYKTVSLFSFQ